MKTADTSHTVLGFDDVEKGLTLLGLFGLIETEELVAVKRRFARGFMRMSCGRSGLVENFGWPPRI